MFKLFFMFWTLCLPSNDFNWVRENIKTSRQLEFVMSMCYEYRKDTSQSDQWEDLRVAVRRQAFDCEEYGGIVYTVLTRHGYDCILYKVRNEDSAHVITEFRKGKDIGYFSNGRRYKDKRFTIDKYIEDSKYTDWRVVQYNWRGGK